MGRGFAYMEAEGSRGRRMAHGPATASAPRLREAASTAHQREKNPADVIIRLMQTFSPNKISDLQYALNETFNSNFFSSKYSLSFFI